MKKKIAIALALAVITLAGGILVFAQGRHGKRLGRFGGGSPLEHIARKLNLTDTQKTQIRAILEAERPTVQPIAARMLANQQQLNQLTANGQFDEQQVRAIATQQGQLASQLIVEKERVQAQIYQILTPEQRTQAQELRTEIEARIRERIEQHLAQ